ncbi:hypothetical protein BDM02DRAFT_3112428 [Thelephora ganbajun]|uniref:Uncharacterized protein n=1 Tax=Thelephora ganbajun TaxID=370292 RepID=A0ACB6ZL64_THEGA|nr:hypothetical protein BDM02DRAFT_3112428 [Thelephora ganbajun]
MSSGAVVTTPVPPSVSTSKITPNPHPYAIKTTSTGLLTRSNSSSQNVHVSRHYYVPPSPTAKKHGETGGQSLQIPQSSRRTHRLSKSLSGVDSFEPSNKRPLPIPPPHPSSLPPYEPSVNPEQWITPKRSKRTEAPPSTTPDLDVTPVKLEDLPTNPKLWTPSQLSSYLTTALRVRSGEAMSLPLPVARDIATFVKESKINGRLFLRLCEQDLDQMGVNQLWKDALLTSSRNLRRNVLKGKIWGSPAEADPDDDPFANLSNSSASSLESLHNATDGDAPGPYYIKPYRRYRNGRVRGMVESFERSGSFSSDSSFSELAERNAFVAQYDANQEVTAQSPVEAPSHFPELSAPSPLPLPFLVAGSPSRSPSKRPLPQIPVHPNLRELPVEEPTVEELLEAEGEELGSSWGARAWEEFDNKSGVTVKKLIQDAPHSDDINPDTTIGGLSTAIESRSREGSNGKKPRDDRRIVTAIFSPPVPSASQVSGLIQAPEHIASKSRREEELEDQVKSTTLMLEEYKKRLEEVERKVSHMTEVEVRLAQKIEKADQENKELQEKAREAERKTTRFQSDPSRSHAVVDARASAVARRKKVIENMDPQSISALSRYVLLVGMGVCAVVFRVVLKKVIGKGLKP